MGFWGRNNWILANGQSELITGFDPNRLKDGAYRLTVGNEAIVSSSFEDKEGAFKNLSESEALSLRPGQFAFLITNEVVSIPKVAMGFINIATKTKLKGLVNISGFHVDPGYKGKLIFSVFNAGPTSITIGVGEPMFRIWLSDHDPSGEPDYVESKTSYSSIPREWADSLYGSFPSPFSLAARVADLESKVSDLKAQRNSLVIPAILFGLLMFPFAAGLYANIISATYNWFYHSKDEVVPSSNKPS